MTKSVQVPVEPTEEMLNALEGVGDDAPNGTNMSWQDYQRHVWAQVLAAAPAAESAEPVAWMWEQAYYAENDLRGRGWKLEFGLQDPKRPSMTRNVTPLYASPPPVAETEKAAEGEEEIMSRLAVVCHELGYNFLEIREALARSDWK